MECRRGKENEPPTKPSDEDMKLYPQHLANAIFPDPVLVQDQDKTQYMNTKKALEQITEKLSSMYGMPCSPGTTQKQEWKIPVTTIENKTILMKPQQGKQSLRNRYKINGNVFCFCPHCFDWNQGPKESVSSILAYGKVQKNGAVKIYSIFPHDKSVCQYGEPNPGTMSETLTEKNPHHLVKGMDFDAILGDLYGRFINAKNDK